MRHEARIGRVEEVIVEGPSRRDPALFTGRTRQNKMVHVPSPEHPRSAAWSTCEVVAGRDPLAAGRVGRGRGRRAPAPARGSRWWRSEPVRTDPACRPRRADGVGEVGAGPGLGPPSRRRRDRLGRLDAGVPGHGHRHGQADSGRPGRRAPPPHRSRRRPRGLHRRGSSRSRPASRSPRSSAGGIGRCWSAGPALHLRAIIDDLEIPGQYPEVRAELELEVDTAPTPPAAAAPRSCRRRHAWSPRIAVGSCGPSRSRSAATDRSRRSGPGWTSIRRHGSD